MSCNAAWSRDKSSLITAGVHEFLVFPDSLCPGVAKLKLMVPEQAEDSALNKQRKHTEGAFRFVIFFFFFLIFGSDMRVMLNYF